MTRFRTDLYRHRPYRPFRRILERDLPNLTDEEYERGVMDAIFLLNDCIHLTAVTKVVTKVVMRPYIPRDDDYIWNKLGHNEDANSYNKWTATDLRLQLLQKDFMCDPANENLENKYYISHLTSCWMVLPDECVRWVDDPYNWWVDGVSLQMDRMAACLEWLWFVPQVRVQEYTESMSWADPDLCTNDDVIRLSRRSGIAGGVLEEARLLMVAIELSAGLSVEEDFIRGRFFEGEDSSHTYRRRQRYRSSRCVNQKTSSELRELLARVSCEE